MKAALLLLAISCGTLLSSTAQEITPKPASDPVVEHLRRHESDGDADGKKSNEISVILDDVGTPPVADPEPTEEAKKTDEGKKPEPAKPDTKPDESAKPLLVTGKPPQDAKVAKPETPPAPIGQDDPDKGVAIQVEKLQGGNGPIDPKTVKLLAPFQAKPLTPAPAGWTFDSTGKAPSFTREVELSAGSKITLNIRPHVLEPLADGQTHFTIQEPGFDPSKGFQQSATVGSILTTSIRQLDEDAKKLGDAIDRLQQLLVTLPTPPEEPAPTAVPIPESPPTPRKR